MKKILVALTLNSSEKNAPYSTSESTRKLARGTILSILALAFGIVAASNQAHAADRHNFRSGKLLAEQQLGSENDCKPNQMGQIGHLILADENIISSNRKKHNNDNLFLEASFSVSSLGFSDAKVKEFEATLSQQNTSALGRIAQLSEISQRIQSQKPILSITRGGKTIATCDLSKSLEGWDISHGAWYCSNSPLTATLRANTIKLNFPRVSMGNVPEEGVLSCVNSQMQSVKPKLKRGDSVKIMLPDQKIIYQAIAKKKKS